MKEFIILIIVFLLGFGSAIIVQKAAIETRQEPGFDDLCDAIHYIESRRGADMTCWNIGPAGEWGEYQITPQFVDEANRIFGREQYTLKDRADNWQCLQMMRIVLTHHAVREGYDRLLDMAKAFRKTSSIRHTCPTCQAYADRVDRIINEKFKKH